MITGEFWTRRKNQLVVQSSLTSDSKEASVNEQMYPTVAMSPSQDMKHQLGMNAHLSRDSDNKVSREHIHIQLDQLVRPLIWREQSSDLSVNYSSIESRRKSFFLNVFTFHFWLWSFLNSLLRNVCTNLNFQVLHRCSDQHALLYE